MNHFASLKLQGDVAPEVRPRKSFTYSNSSRHSRQRIALDTSAGTSRAREPTVEVVTFDRVAPAFEVGDLALEYPLAPDRVRFASQGGEPGLRVVCVPYDLLSRSTSWFIYRSALVTDMKYLASYTAQLPNPKTLQIIERQGLLSKCIGETREVFEGYRKESPYRGEVLTPASRSPVAGRT